MSDMKTNWTWGGFLGKYFKNSVQTEKQPEKIINTNYNEFEKTFYKKREVIADEPLIPNEEYQKELELIKAYDFSNSENDQNLNDQNIIFNNEPEIDFTADEIEEFKRLNGIVDVVEQPTETKVKSIKVTKTKEAKTKKDTKTIKEKKSENKKPIKKNNIKEEKKEDLKKKEVKMEIKPRAPRKTKK